MFDLPTTDTSAFNSVFWAGLAAGTNNVITIVDTGFNATDGSVINFTALYTNTASTTINPSGYGAIPVEKDTTAGPVSLTGGEIIQNNVISVVYRASDNAFHLLNPPIQSVSGTTAPRCGITGLKITNDGSTPNSIMDLTATTVVLSSASGTTVNRSNISTTVNISLGTVTSTVGGMDGEAPGTSAWLDFFLIDNGSATAAVASLAAGNGLAPNLPSGYTYKCYAGAARVDGSGNILRILQYGNRSQYTVVSPSNTQHYPSIGTTTSATMAALSVSSVVPPTATNIFLGGTSQGGGANTYVAISSNNVSPVTPGTTDAPILFGDDVNANRDFASGSMLLESTNIYAATDSGTAYIYAYGWIDGQVNAP